MNIARIASVEQMNSPPFQAFLNEFEDFTRAIGLDDRIRYCRRWEYPWLWLNGLKDAVSPILDIGSALSPLPWFLGDHTDGAVVMTEMDECFQQRWLECQQFVKTHNPRLSIGWVFCKDEELWPFRNDFFSTITSVSVIEHQPNKELAVSELIRVLKPGGKLFLTFDVFEPSLGMIYPRTDIPMSLEFFESHIWKHPAFDTVEPLHWNFGDVPDFLAWHRTTAPQHTYVAGGAILTKKLQ